MHHLENKGEGALLRASLEELALGACSSSRLLAVHDRTNFRRRLENIEQSFNLQNNSQFSYLLNRTVISSMLPTNSFVATMTSNAILRALAVTTPERIFLANPFKDSEQLKLAFSRGI